MGEQRLRLYTYVVDADASASLHIASKESAGGQNLRSLHLGWIGGLLISDVVFWCGEWINGMRR
jgi:hypothetical protein